MSEARPGDARGGVEVIELAIDLAAERLHLLLGQLVVVGADHGGAPCRNRSVRQEELSRKRLVVGGW